MDDEKKHPCNQEATLATICEKLVNIEEDIREIKDSHRVFMDSLTSSMTNSAKYPSPDFVNKAVAKLDRHDLYFKIIWVVGSFGWVILLFLLDKFWVK